jgi:hypothetical protein
LAPGGAHEAPPAPPEPPVPVPVPVPVLVPVLAPVPLLVGPAGPPPVVAEVPGLSSSGSSLQPAAYEAAVAAKRSKDVFRIFIMPP